MMTRNPLFGDGKHNPVIGELVRYGHGSTALAIVRSKHGPGYHGDQCMGGSAYFNATVEASDHDRATWIHCAEFRRETVEESAAQFGLSEVPPKPSFPGIKPASPPNVAKSVPFVDSPQKAKEAFPNMTHVAWVYGFFVGTAFGAAWYFVYDLVHKLV